MNPPVEGMKTRPYGEDYMAGAWVGFIEFAATDDRFLDRFKAATGQDFRSLLRRTPMDEMIDKATGRERAVFVAFCDWLTKTEWGEEE